VEANVVLRNVYAALDEDFSLQSTAIVWIAISDDARSVTTSGRTFDQVVSLWNSPEELMEVCIPLIARDSKAGHRNIIVACHIG